MDGTFQTFLSEKFYNAFTREDKELYAQEVWDILVQSYKSIGGLRGINSKEDMIAKVPMWKIAIVDKKVVAVVMYKDKGTGRKLVAVGTDNSNEAKDLLKNMMTKEFERSFFEISGPFYKFINKHFPELVAKYTIPYDEVEKILNKPISPTKNGFYKREIQGDILEKIMIGTAHKTIT